MLMPKASMNEDDLFAPWEDDIGLARQASRMKSIAVAKLRQDRAGCQFGASVPASVALHHLTNVMMSHHCRVNWAEANSRRGLLGEMRRPRSQGRG